MRVSSLTTQWILFHQRTPFSSAGLEFTFLIFIVSLIPASIAWSGLTIHAFTELPPFCAMLCPSLSPLCAQFCFFFPGIVVHTSLLLLLPVLCLLRLEPTFFPVALPHFNPDLFQYE